MLMYATSDGASLAYEDRGPRGGIPLLFVHGWQGAGAVWKLVIDELATRHRTIAVDVRGYAGSNAAPGPYNVDVFANDLSDLLAALDLDPLVAIGHSMGAKIVQRFAIDRPEALEGLVLVAPVSAGSIALSARTAAMFHEVADDPAKAVAWLGTLTYAQPPREIVALLHAAAATVPPRVARESFDSWTQLDFEDEARTIETPTLVIAAEADSPERARAGVASVIEGSRFEIVPDAGHYVILEQPAAIATLIEGFVASL